MQINIQTAFRRTIRVVARPSPFAGHRGDDANFAKTLPFHLLRQRNEQRDDAKLIDGKGFFGNGIVVFAFDLVEQITMSKQGDVDAAKGLRGLGDGLWCEVGVGEVIAEAASKGFAQSIRQRPFFSGLRAKQKMMAPC